MQVRTQGSRSGIHVLLQWNILFIIFYSKGNEINHWCVSVTMKRLTLIKCLIKCGQISKVWTSNTFQRFSLWVLRFIQPIQKGHEKFRIGPTKLHGKAKVLYLGQNNLVLVVLLETDGSQIEQNQQCQKRSGSYCECLAENELTVLSEQQDKLHILLKASRSR